MLHVLEHSYGLLYLTCPSADVQVPCALITFSLPRKPDPDGRFLNLQFLTFYLEGEKRGRIWVKISSLASSQYVSVLHCVLPLCLLQWW